MKISLIASPNGTLFMAWDNGKNQYPVVVADFGSAKENIALANELMSLYNGHQSSMESSPTNVISIKRVDPSPISSHGDVSGGS